MAERPKLTADQTLEMLRDVVAHLAGATSAYKHFAKRHHSLGHVQPDALFTTRLRDFENAVERGRQYLASLENVPEEQTPRDNGAPLRDRDPAATASLENSDEH